MMTIRQIKTFAKRQLKGNLLAAIGAMILTFICSLVWATAFVAAVLFGVVGPLSGHVIMDAIRFDPMMRLMFFSGAGIIITALLFTGFYIYFGLMLGTQMLYLSIAKGKKVSAFEIFKGFSSVRHMKHYIGVFFIIYIIEAVLMIPESYIGVKYGFHSMDHNITSWIAGFLSFVIMLYLCMAGFASAHHPDMKATKAITVSAHLMRNRKMKMIGFELSFIGWFLLGICTGGLAFFWVLPYFNTAYSVFYLSAYGQDYQSKIQDAEFKESAPRDTYVRGDARPEGTEGNAETNGLTSENVTGTGSDSMVDANANGAKDSQSAEPRKSFEEVRSQYTDIRPEVNTGVKDAETVAKEVSEESASAAETAAEVAPVSGDTALKKSYKSEEDAFAAYEQWKRDHGITIENQDPFHDAYRDSNDENETGAAGESSET